MAERTFSAIPGGSHGNPAPDRPERLKPRKDIMQTEFLIRILSDDRPDELREAYGDAVDSGLRWRERLDRAPKHTASASDILKHV